MDPTKEQKMSYAEAMALDSIYIYFDVISVLQAQTRISFTK